MPRYIDADALVRRLKHSPLFLGTQMQFKDGVIDLVEKQPTADVVPRAEVAREIFNNIIPCLAYTRFASPLEKESTLNYMYALRNKYTEEGK